MEKFFNFNNEQGLTPIDVNQATGEVSFELDGDTHTFGSVQEFAEFYADARNVKPDNLKNWTLVEDGDTYSFILRAGSAGLDERDLANTARTLRASGMSPEEVARAMYNMQAEMREQEEAANQLSEREDIIESTLARVKDSNDEKLLFLAYDVESSEELRAAVEDDALLFEDNRNIPNSGVYNNDGYEYYNDEYEYERTGEPHDYDAERESDVFAMNINQKISAQAEEVKTAFAGLPLDIALAIVFGEQVKEQFRDGATEAFTKAKLAAGAAGRAVPITIVDCADVEAPVVTRTFHNKDGVDVAEGTLCLYNRRFISLKNFNPIIVNEKDFNDIEEKNDGAWDIDE